MYHRFGDSDHVQTNVRIEQFEAHLAEIAAGPYKVLPVPEILARLRAGEALPERTVGITIDDAFRSVYTEAFPRLRKAGLPFTLFVATAAVDRGLADYMSWDQIRELRDAGVVIGSQTHTHLHMALRGGGASRADIETSNRRFEKELGKAPKLFAYPYGETSSAVVKAVRNAGFSAAFGQHSGVLHRTSNPFFLPRFAFNEVYGDIRRFRLVANALPLPVDGITPSDPLVRHNPPAFGFTVNGSIPTLDRLACYHSTQGKMALERIGERRVEARFAAPLPTGRSRVNCTLPGPDNRWRWFGVQFYTP